MNNPKLKHTEELTVKDMLEDIKFEGQWSIGYEESSKKMLKKINEYLRKIE